MVYENWQGKRDEQVSQTSQEGTRSEARTVNQCRPGGAAAEAQPPRPPGRGLQSLAKPKSAYKER